MTRFVLTIFVKELSKIAPIIAEKMNFISIEGVSTFRVKHSLTTSEIFSAETRHMVKHGLDWTGLVNMDWTQKRPIISKHQKGAKVLLTT